MPVIESISTVVVSVSLLFILRRQRKRRREIREYERLLDQNGIHYTPSTMYRFKKGFLNMFRKKVRKNCKVDEYDDGEDAINWDEYDA